MCHMYMETCSRDIIHAMRIYRVMRVYGSGNIDSGYGYSRYTRVYK